MREDQGKSGTATSGRPEVVTDPATSARLARVRQKGTAPELIVRSAVRALGHRYRLDNRDLPGSPDLANRRGKWAIFVNGCYWHHHEGCRRATVPRRNRKFWEAKFAANKERDTRAVMELEQRGWKVLTVWECEAGNAVTLQGHLRHFFSGPPCQDKF